MGDVRGAIYSTSRRPSWSSSAVQQGQSSSLSRKRAHSPALPRRRRRPPPCETPDWCLPCETPSRCYSDDDSDGDTTILNDGSHRWDDTDDGLSGGSDAAAADDDSDADTITVNVVDDDDVAGGVAAAEQEDSDDDDDRPISVVPRARNRASTAPAQAPLSSSFSDDNSSVARNMTVESSSAFDCSICYHPLKSPIFQCTVGHVVCSPCHDKMGQTTSCHVCRVPMPDGYSRCIAMEHVVDSIRVRCPHAAHGCTVKPAYHEHAAHARTCAHKPCHCPADGCRFAGSVQTSLLEHFAAVHGWPCTAGRIEYCGFDVHLRKGFNVIAATEEEEQQYTLVLKVEQTAPVCNSITAFCIHPTKTGIVRVGLSYCRWWRRDSGLPSAYLQSSELEVLCTDLSNGVPGRSSCHPFLVPRWSNSPGGDDGDDIRVTVNYIRNPFFEMY